MHILNYIYIYIYIYVHTFIYLFIYLFINFYTSLRRDTFSSTCIIQSTTRSPWYIYIYIYIYIYVYIYICVYIYIYIYLFINFYTSHGRDTFSSICTIQPTTRSRCKLRICTYTMTILCIVYLYIHFCDMKWPKHVVFNIIK